MTFDQNAPFSLNGPFLSLSNDMTSTHVDQWNVTVERQIDVDLVRVGGLSGQPDEQHLGIDAAQQRRVPNVGNGVAPSAANINARRPFTLQDPVNGQYYGPVDLYVTDGTQHYNGMILSVTARLRAHDAERANYTLSHCYGSPDGFGGATTNVSVRGTTSRAIPATTTATARPIGSTTSR